MGGSRQIQREGNSIGEWYGFRCDPFQKEQIKTLHERTIFIYTVRLQFREINNASTRYAALIISYVLRKE